MERMVFLMRMNFKLGILAILLCTAGCANNSLTQQGRITDLQNDRTKLISERDSYENRYNEIVETNRRQTLQIATSQQDIQLLKKEQVALQNRLKETSDKLVSVTEERDKLAEIAKNTDSGTGSSISSNTNGTYTGPLPSIPGTTASVSGKEIHIEIPGDSLFDSEGTRFTAQGADLIAQAGSTLTQLYPGTHIRIESHASSFRRTSASFKSPLDQTLGQATMTQQLLVNRGICQPNTLSVTGCGVSIPKISNTSEEGAARNYRIELVIVPTN